jgi:hypothetical protein
MDVKYCTFIVDGIEYIFDEMIDGKIHLKLNSKTDDLTLGTLGMNETIKKTEKIKNTENIKNTDKFPNIGGYKNSLSQNVFNTFQMSNSNLLIGGGISYNTQLSNYSATSTMKTASTLNSIFDF